jgi:hypothetical protein
MLQMLAETDRGLHVACPLFLSDFNQNWSVLTNFSITLLSKFMEIHSVVLKFLLADRHGGSNRPIFGTLRWKHTRHIIFVIDFHYSCILSS